ncbi:diguanylate cyclase [Congregibacter variabilis]|uniref:diguanylate cyclase n=1 Tax=Congregibacter variabilis TaxID=3081200 RepID=A0ABZ0I747_9GAMM|nr:diguanylate cyclase [Congregibacter sp. IMCC43200]
MNPQDSLSDFFAELCLREDPQAVTDSLNWLGAFVLTHEGVIIAANSDFCDLLGQNLDSLVGTPAVDVITPSEKAPMESRFAHNDTTPYTLKLAMPDQSIKVVRVTPHLLSLDGKTCRLAAFSDVSEYVLLKDTTERYQSVFAAAGIGIARVNPDGSWLECNDKLCEILGYQEAELLQTSFQAITHPEDLDTDLQYVKEMLAGTRATYCMEKRYLHKKGHYLWARLTVTLVKDIAGNPQYFVSLIQEITAEKEAEAATQELNRALENLSFTDGLTGIGNRRKFDAALRNEWRRARRDKTRIALIIADIDHFKLFNDELGHLAGDDCLKDIARTVAQHANRVSDCVARYGGEEFVILLPGVGLNDAINMAQECRKAVEALGISRGDHSPSSVATISLGVAEVDPSHEQSPEVLIDAADHRLYEAKHAGRNTVMPATE